MRTVRWRWVLVPMVVLIGSCLPSPMPDVPASFFVALGGSGTTFTAQTPPAGETWQDIVAAVQAEMSTATMFRGRAVPVFGVIDCHGDPECAPGPGANHGDGQQARTVWAVFYPECTDADGNSGFVVVDAVNGVIGGNYYMFVPCDQ